MADVASQEPAEISKELRGFVTFALGMKPVLVMNRTGEEGADLTLTISAGERVVDEEVASLEPLMARYELLKPALDAIRNTKESVATCKPTSHFEPNVHYRLIRVTEQQYRIAKEVAARLDRIHAARVEEDDESAQREYDDFHRYLGKERAALIGEFQRVHFSNAEVSFGANRLAAADDDCSGVVIFIIIEVFIG